MSDEKPAPTLIQPDLDFIRWITRSGGGDSLKKCFQCATCSVVCTLSPEEKPFPRKEMIWAQWGLKDRLLTDVDVWLCEQCNDCSTQCPRGARPGDVMAAIRNHAIQRFAWPGWLGKALSQPKYLVLLVLFPVVLGALLSLPFGEKGQFDFMFLGEGATHFIPFEEFMSHPAIYGVFVTMSVLLIVSAWISIRRFWAALNGGMNSPPLAKGGAGGGNAAPLGPSLVAALTEIVTHQQLRKCAANRPRYIAHLLIFYGFIGLLITTAFVVVGLYAFGWELPWGLDHPVRGFFKILGNVSGLALVAGCVLAIVQRLRGGDETGKSAYWDWLFVIVLCAVGTTGLLVQFARLMSVGPVPYLIYGLHLLLVFFLLAYFPHSKFAHLIYRIVAKVHAKVYDRYGEREA